MLLLAGFAPADAKAKGHVVSLGEPHSEHWAAAGTGEQLQLLVRPLYLDGTRKAWVNGQAHIVTDHSFVVLQADRLNDAMPGEKTPHYIWQTGAWLLVDRATGHISPVKFDGYDAEISGLSWFRNYAAYCAVTHNGKELYAEVTELGSRRAVAHKRVGDWPLAALAHPVEESAEPEAEAAAPASGTGSHAIGPAPRVPSLLQRLNTGAAHPRVCGTIEWQRDPLRAIVTPREDMVPISLDLNPAQTAAAEAAADKPPAAPEK